MKENKKFFKNNSLNRGYANINRPKPQDASKQHQTQANSNYQNLLPNIELIEYYEEIFPGTLEKLLELAKQEQQHRHILQQENVKVQEKINLVTKIATISYVLLICLTTIVLALFQASVVVTAIFAFSAFGVILLATYLPGNFGSAEPPLAYEKRRHKKHFNNHHHKRSNS